VPFDSLKTEDMETETVLTATLGGLDTGWNYETHDMLTYMIT
jgi:hypothetical protein